jgi:hypothetical protein
MKLGWTPNRRKLCNRVGSVGWAGCICLLLNTNSSWTIQYRAKLTSFVKFIIQHFSNYSFSWAKWQNVITLNCSGQNFLVPLPSKWSLQWCFDWRLLPTPYCDWLLCFPAKVKFHQEEEYSIAANNSHSGTEAIPCLLWNHVQRSLPLISILRQMNPIHTSEHNLPTTHSNIIMLSMPGCSECCLPLELSNQNFVRAQTLYFK